MAEFRCYQVDAFASKAFEGNPAAVMPLGAWLEDRVLQQIAQENNLSETAFFVPAGDGFALRWFTPTIEAELCGHATLASAFILMTELEPQRTQVRFDSRSGPLGVTRQGDMFTLDFPARTVTQVPDDLAAALGKAPKETWKGPHWMCVFDSEDDVRSLRPDFRALDREVIITAPGKQHDFVSRFFAPTSGIDEDPVTGSAHCTLAPYWGKRLGKQRMHARQVSARGGELHLRLDGDRVHIGGRAALVTRGTMYL